jgi:nitrate reductase assembly molybdenum cofactor insertion protein NarJ
MIKKIKDQDDFFQEIVEKINKDAKEVRFIATEKMEFSLGEVKDHFSTVFQTMKTNNLETKEHMNREFNRL